MNLDYDNLLLRFQQLQLINKALLYTGLIAYALVSGVPGLLVLLLASAFFNAFMEELSYYNLKKLLSNKD